MSKHSSCLLCNYQYSLNAISPYASKFLCADHWKEYTTAKMDTANAEQTEAKRETRNQRFDLLIPEFLGKMAELASHGATKYGDRNWQNSRLEGDKSPLNHIYTHLAEFQTRVEHDYFGTVEDNLVSIAFNAMMEWWYEHNFPRDKQRIGLGQMAEKRNGKN